MKPGYPLVIFDTETTGIDVRNDRIVEIAIVRIEADGAVSTFETLVNPTIPIGKTAQEVHGIRNADVSGHPSIEAYLSQIKGMFRPDGEGRLPVISGYNVRSYDIPLLDAECIRYGFIPLSDWGHPVLDAISLFRMQKPEGPHKLGDAFLHYTRKPQPAAHRAMEDVRATYAVLRAQLRELYGFKLLETVKAVNEFFLDRQQIVTQDLRVLLGRHAGKELVHLYVHERKYFLWLESIAPREDLEIYRRVKLMARAA